MGEVYRARDTRLHRDVAIKVLPDLFARDPDRLARFEREAQVLAALNHSSIAHMYGTVDLPPDGGSQGVLGLVMEFADGEDLSATIARGPVPLGDALPIARQIADALEAAHEHGIVHRDLKPANIKVRADGTVKVLDFGLAKAMDPAASGADAMRSPTLTARATQMGVIIGTAAYMAPEQARGKTVDKRADIWAFGVVLFEMITGRRVFGGTETTDVLARVLERDPEWTWLPAVTPPAVRYLLERCLAKDPRARLRDIGEARHVLDEVIAGRSGSPALSAPAPEARAVRRPSAWLPWAVTAVVAAAGGYAWLRPAAGRSPQPTRLELRLPENVEFYTAPRISMDGRRVAFLGGLEGIRRVYVRDLDQSEWRAVPGTEGSINVAMSPDARAVAIISTDGRLRRLNLDAGGSEDLASGVDAVGGLSWTRDDRILFGRVSELVSIPAAGGPAKTIVTAGAAEGETLISPMSTPDGRMLVFTSMSGPPGAVTSRIEAVPTNGGPRHVVLEQAGYVQGVSTDRLLFQRETSLYAAPFDAVRAIVTGQVTKLTDEARASPTGGVLADVSDGGHVLFADTRTSAGRLTWVSLDGVERPITLPARAYLNPRVSPDGRMVAYSDGPSIWTTDTERGAQTRIFNGTDSLSGFPVWSRDGTHLFFRTSSGVTRLRADGEGKAEVVTGSKRSDYPSGLSPDGSLLLITRIEPGTSGDVILVPLHGGAPRALVSTPAYEGGAQLSPDGRWIAYVSNSSGRMEVYLRSVDGPERFPVSTAGGVGPLWSGDGRRIFFRNGLQWLAVDVAMTPAVTLSAPKLLFERRYSFGSNITIANYSLSSDSRDFLMVTTGPGDLSLILNWLQPAGR